MLGVYYAIHTACLGLLFSFTVDLWRQCGNVCSVFFLSLWSEIAGEQIDDALRAEHQFEFWATFAPHWKPKIDYNEKSLEKE